MPDSSESERLFSDSLDRENFPDRYPFNVILSGDDTRSDCIFNFAPTLCVVVGDSVFLVLASLEVKVTALNKDEAPLFIQTFRYSFGHDLSDTKIRNHLKFKTQSASIDCLRPLDVVQDERYPKKY